jgi:hypothetical protein
MVALGRRDRGGHSGSAGGVGPGDWNCTIEIPNDPLSFIAILKWETTSGNKAAVCYGVFSQQPGL